MNPLWAKAPIVLLRFTGIFVALATGALLLSLATAVSPLFLSSARSAVLASELEDATAFGAGVSVVQDGYHPGPRGQRIVIAERERRLRHALDDEPRLSGPIVTALVPPTLPSTSPAQSAHFPVRALAKTDALAHVTRLAGREGDGFWIADTAAQGMGVQPGETIYLTAESGDRQVQLSIDGIYRALWKEPPSPYWRSLTAQIYNYRPGVGGRTADAPPTFLIGGRSQVEEVATELATQLELRWEWPLATTDLTLQEAESLQRRIERFQRDAEGVAPPIRVPQACEGCPRSLRVEIAFSSLLSTAVSRATERVSALRGPADVISASAILVGLVVVAAAGAFAVARRRVEARLLFARGASPASVGARTAVEALLPVTLGAAAGYALAAAAVSTLGPGGRVDPQAFVDAALRGAVAIPVAAALVGAVAAFAFSRESEGARTRGARLAGLPWEIAALAGAAYLLFRVRANGALIEEVGEAARPSYGLLLFPLLLLAGTAGIAARALIAPLRRASRRSGGMPAAPYLALHRLAAARRLVPLLVAACALTLGVFVYAQTVVRSLEETVHAKSRVFVGSDVHGVTSPDREIPADFPLPATLVTKMPTAAEMGGAQVDVMAVDPATLASAAFWDASWAARPLAEIAQDLRDRGGVLRAVVAGNAASDEALALAPTSFRLNIVERVRVFPGMSLRRPLVVVDRAGLERVTDEAGIANPVSDIASETQAWVKGETDDAIRVLQPSRLRPFPIVTAEEIERNASIQAVTNTFALLKLLGFGSSLLAVVGVLVYMQSRHRGRVISYALARRMGLQSASHRNSLTLEVASILAASFVLGVLVAVAAAKLVLGDLDTLANVPPAPLLRIPTAMIASAAMALGAVSLVGGWVAHRAAARGRIGEVIRLGD